MLILWSRFGTPLTEPLRPDGSRYLSGTEWEYEDAISGEVPILLHRRISDPQVSLRDADYAEKRRQLELVDAFFKRFTEPGGAATGGYIQYNDMSDFKDKFRRIVESAIRQSLDAEAISSSQSLDAEITTPWQPSMLAIVDRLTRQLAEKEKEIANLRQTLILRSASQSSPPVEHRPEHDSELGHPPAAQVEVLHLDSTEVQAVARDPAVEAIAPVIPIKLIAPLTELGMPAETPGIAWGVTAVGADKSPFTGNGVVVAVLDTGIDTAYPAFTGLTIIKRDFSGEGNGDWHGHGTHFAGTVFGRPVDGTRIGVAPGVNRALIAKTIGSKGGSSDALVLALNWAIEEGAEVIVLSLRFDLVTLQRQFRELDSMSERPLEAFRANVRLFDSLFKFMRGLSATRPLVIVAAAGNESQRELNPNAMAGVCSPADSDGIISVAALSQSLNGLTISPFSNTGAQLSAPGARIVSARAGGGLTSFSGTSMAAGHVAGVAALWIEKLKAAGLQGASFLSARLLSSASRSALQPGFDPFDVGYGIVRAPQD